MNEDDQAHAKPHRSLAAVGVLIMLASTTEIRQQDPNLVLADLRGCSQGVAEAYLSQENLFEKVAGGDNPWIVSSTDPPPGTKVVRGDTIAVLYQYTDISCSLASVPKLIDLTVGDAVDFANKLGFAVEAPTAGAGSVVKRQDPVPGYLASLGSTILVWAVVVPPKSTLPDTTPPPQTTLPPDTTLAPATTLPPATTPEPTTLPSDTTLRPHPTRTSKPTATTTVTSTIAAVTVVPKPKEPSVPSASPITPQPRPATTGPKAATGSTAVPTTSEPGTASSVQQPLPATTPTSTPSATTGAAVAVTGASTTTTPSPDESARLRVRLRPVGALTAAAAIGALAVIARAIVRHPHLRARRRFQARLGSTGETHLTGGGAGLVAWIDTSVEELPKEAS